MEGAKGRGGGGGGKGRIKEEDDHVLKCNTRFAENVINFD